MKETQDGAEPASSSTAIANLARLAALSQPEQAAQLQERAKQCAAAYQDSLSQIPVALTQMCCSLYLLTAGQTTFSSQPPVRKLSFVCLQHR